jgi:hypothetical protein
MGRANGVHPQTAPRWLRQEVLSGPGTTTAVGHDAGRASGSAGPLRVEQVAASLSAQGGRIMVADPAEMTDDLVGDMIEVLTSFCARPCGRRGTRNRALRAVTCATRPPTSSPDLKPACGGGEDD